MTYVFMAPLWVDIRWWGKYLHSSDKENEVQGEEELVWSHTVNSGGAEI